MYGENLTEQPYPLPPVGKDKQVASLKKQTVGKGGGSYTGISKKDSVVTFTLENICNKFFSRISVNSNCTGSVDKKDFKTKFSRDFVVTFLFV